MSGDTMTLPNKTVERIYNALVTLSRRTLPDINSDLKVARLRRHFQPLAEPIEEARQKQLIENSVDVAGESQLQNAAAVAASNLEIANKPCEFTKPTLTIVQGDLPKELKGEPSARNPFSGNANATGRSEIIAELDFLFELPDATE